MAALGLLLILPLLFSVLDFGSDDTSGGGTPTDPDPLEDPEFLTAQADVFDGTDADERVHGLAGDDTIQGGAGNDDLFGAAGNDSIEGGNGSDLVFGGNGDDTVSGLVFNDLVVGGNGDDVVNGNGGSDAVYGDAGNDVVRGGAGNDFASGGLGDDLVSGGLGSDTLTGSGIFSRDLTFDELSVFANNNLLPDDVSVGILDDRGSDTLFGGSGQDVLFIGGGDTASGGDGNDIFVMLPTITDGSTADDNGPGILSGPIVIEDFQPGSDTLVFEYPQGTTEPDVNFSQNGNDVQMSLITPSGFETIGILLNVTAADLQANDDMIVFNPIPV